MSKVVIQGNASGTGNFTIAAPNSNTDRTLTLPDHAGTVLASNSVKIDETNGRVGIGTASPETPVQVKVANQLGSSFTGTTRGEGLSVAQNGYTASNYVSLVEAPYNAGGAPNVRIGAQFHGGGSELVFGTTSSYAAGVNNTALIINNAADVQIGTTSSAITSATSGTIVNSSGYFDTKRNSTAAASHHQFYNPNGFCGFIYTTGSSTVYATSSDYRLKENVIEVTDGIDRIKLLKPSRFNFIADPDTTVDGFLAHEVQDIVPEAISGTKDAVDEEGNPEYQGIDQSKLVPLLTAALQESIAKIEALEARVTALENA